MRCDPDDDWIDRSVAADDLDIEVSFLLTEAVPGQVRGDPELHPLVQPAFVRRDPLLARTREVVGFESELADYYRRLAALTTEPAYYWLRLEIFSPCAGAHVRFPWWDRIGDMQGLFGWLRAAADGDQVSDLDQGWAFAAKRVGDQLHVLDYGWEDGIEEFDNVRVSHADLLRRLDAAEARTMSIIAGLRRETGLSFWL